MGQKHVYILGGVAAVALIGLIIIQTQYFYTAFGLKKTNFDYTVNRSLDDVVSKIEKYIHQREAEYRTEGKEVHKDIVEIMDSPIPISAMDLTEENPSSNAFLNNRQNSDLKKSLLKYRQTIKEKFGTDFDVVLKKHDSNSDPIPSIEVFVNELNLEQIIKDRLKNNGIDIIFECAIKEKDSFIYASQQFYYEKTDYTYSKRIFDDEKSGGATLYVLFSERSESLFSLLKLILPGLLVTIVLIVCFVIAWIVILKQKKLSVIKNDFINNMTHEFKTPIATISLASQMLKDNAVEQTPESIMHIAGIIGDESKRLTFQVEKVLQTALFTETRMKLKMKNLYVNEVIGNMISKFKLRIEDKKGILSYQFDANNDEVLADEVHLTNVISNLLDNALKYCEKIPEIGIYTSNNNRDEIVISVIDNGIGIAEKEQKMIFERFYRVSTGNLHNVKGFGLGLSYVKKIIESHNGRVEVESTLGRGSRFDVILPLTTKKQKVNRTLFF